VAAKKDRMRPSAACFARSGIFSHTRAAGSPMRAADRKRWSIRDEKFGHALVVEAE